MFVGAGGALQGTPVSEVGPPLRLLQRAVAQLHTSLATACDSNLYMLRYLRDAGSRKARADEDMADEDDSDRTELDMAEQASA